MTWRRAVGVLCRHGHRAPVAAIAGAAERRLWEQLVPSDATLDAMVRNYPLMIEPTNPPPRDAQTKPFGFISTVGLNAMSQVGEKIASEFPFIKRVDKIKVYATNYRRTQISVQALLAGIQVKNRTYVEVRPQATCAMSRYDAHGDMLIPTMKRVQESAEFKHATDQLSSIQAAMAKEFPALAEHGFEWIHALDYFVCRRSHSLDVLASLKEFEEPVRQHTAWRFQQYYQDPLHLSQVAGPLLQDIVAHLEQTFADEPMRGDSVRGAKLEAETERQPDVTIFGGHDVNIMALGYALGIGATLHARNHSLWWPGYGCTLTFDAYEAPPHDHDTQPTSQGDDDGHGRKAPASGAEVRVRIALDFADMSPACAKGVALTLAKFQKSAHPNFSTLGDEMQQDKTDYGVDVPLSSLKKLAEVMNECANTHEFVRQLLSESEIRAEVP